jgi:hypothetical protein
LESRAAELVAEVVTGGAATLKRRAACSFWTSAFSIAFRAVTARAPLASMAFKAALASV